MVFVGKSLGAALASVLILASSSAFADEWAETLRTSVMTEIEKIEIDSLFKQAELSKRYMSALDALEKKLMAEGNLDIILHIREERQAIEKSGQPSTHADKPITELRDKYNSALKVIRDELALSRKKVADRISLKIKDQETALTRSGKIDEALAVRKDGERLLLELTAGSDDSPVAEAADPRTTMLPDLKPLKQITVPSQTPPANPAPFMIKGRWLEDMTVPPLKQKISGNILIGHFEKKISPLVVLAPGNAWSGSQGVRLDVSLGKFHATKSRFKQIDFGGDNACELYFTNCFLDDCSFAKSGGWWGMDQAVKFYFENCVITERFATKMNVPDTGFRAQSCVFEKIEFARFGFAKKEPADYVNHPWEKLNNCRFVGCEIPISVLLLTRDCIFESCIFVDDPD
ncbi:MAG: hypothetical protein EOP83_27635, partial [Verrucomicrobiaceae bacterium]